MEVTIYYEVSARSVLSETTGISEESLASMAKKLKVAPKEAPGAIVALCLRNFTPQEMIAALNLAVTYWMKIGEGDWIKMDTISADTSNRTLKAYDEREEEEDEDPIDWDSIT